jgi:apolipoprotein N-acyltransferase
MTIITGYLIQRDGFYQKDVSAQIIPHLNVSCVFGQSYRQDTTPTEWDRIWSNTNARLENGDSIVLWSEESIVITSDAEERDVIHKAKDMIIKKSNGNSFLGISYLKQLSNQDNCTNMMVLIAPEGDIAWKYQKSHPVPIVESSVEAGIPNLPTFDTDKLISGRTLRLGGSICFDLDFPHYIHQAGQKKVDVFLQPSWTWKVVVTLLYCTFY